MNITLINILIIARRKSDASMHFLQYLIDFIIISFLQKKLCIKVATKLSKEVDIKKK